MVYRVSAQRLDRDQEMRERILASAQARVSAGGFAALTMQALAEDVGIATGSEPAVLPGLPLARGGGQPVCNAVAIERPGSNPGRHAA